MLSKKLLRFYRSTRLMMTVALAVVAVACAHPTYAQSIDPHEIVNNPPSWIGKTVSFSNLSCFSTLFEDKKLGDEKPTKYHCVTRPFSAPIIWVILVDDLPKKTASYLDYVCYSARFGRNDLKSFRECEPTVAQFRIFTAAPVSGTPLPGIVVAGGIIASVGEFKFEQPNRMEALDFLVDWRDLQNKRITAHSCDLSTEIGRILGGYIHCSVGSGIFRGSNRILIDEETFARESYRRFMKNCTGQGRRDECVVELIGTPSGDFMGMPVMRDVHAIWPDR